MEALLCAGFVFESCRGHTYMGSYFLLPILIVHVGLNTTCQVILVNRFLFFLTILTYGSDTEIWNTTQSQVQTRRLESFHQYQVLHRWFHRVRNEVRLVDGLIFETNILRVSPVITLTDIIATKRLRWFGHVSRMPEDRLPIYLNLLEWKPKHETGKR